MSVLPVGALDLEILHGNAAGGVSSVNFVKRQRRFVFSHQFPPRNYHGLTDRPHSRTCADIKG
jgi:hypothetical protein